MRKDLKCFAMLIVGAASLGAATGATLAFDIPIPPGCMTCGNDGCKDLCGACSASATKECFCNIASKCKDTTL